jgi:catechol-2,3-dioxygenase
VAFVYSDRDALADAVQRVLAHGHPIDHGTDHGATVSVYLADYFDPIELLSTPTPQRGA